MDESFTPVFKRLDELFVTIGVPPPPFGTHPIDALEYINNAIKRVEELKRGIFNP